MGMLDECVLWQRATNSHGYGSVWFQGRNVGAHVRAWVAANGPIPPGMFVCHRCDVRRCVNVDHLWLGTPGDNMRDAASKGRMVSGDAWRAAHQNLPTGRVHHRSQALLTEDEVRSVRLRAGSTTQRALAAEYGVSPDVIGRVVNRKSWAWFE